MLYLSSLSIVQIFLTWCKSVKNYFESLKSNNINIKQYSLKQNLFIVQLTQFCKAQIKKKIQVFDSVIAHKWTNLVLVTGNHSACVTFRFWSNCGKRASKLGGKLGKPRGSGCITVFCPPFSPRTSNPTCSSKLPFKPT